jgi:hypothetical protein
MSQTRHQYEDGSKQSYLIVGSSVCIENRTELHDNLPIPIGSFREQSEPKGEIGQRDHLMNTTAYLAGTHGTWLHI